MAASCHRSKNLPELREFWFNVIGRGDFQKSLLLTVYVVTSDYSYINLQCEEESRVKRITKCTV